MRRDRINNSIEQLKTLLKREIEAHQPSSKLEKADILETAVFYLKENVRPASGGTPGQTYAEGFSRCLEETLSFLCAHNQPTESQQKLANHFSRVPLVQRDTAVICTSRVNDRNCAPKCVSAGGRQPLWRPWWWCTNIMSWGDVHLWGRR